MLDIRISAGIGLAGESILKHELDKAEGLNSLLARGDGDGKRPKTSALGIHLVLAHILMRVSKGMYVHSGRACHS